MAPRDYKRAATPQRRPRAAAGVSRLRWFLLGVAGGVGACALAWYVGIVPPGGLLHAHRKLAAATATASTPSPATASSSRASGSKTPDTAGSKAAGKPGAAKPRFEFYTLLPEMEVPVSDAELARQQAQQQAARQLAAKQAGAQPPPQTGASPPGGAQASQTGAPPQSGTQPGQQAAAAPVATAKAGAPAQYYLQAGSFRALDEADRLKANLAFLGFAPSVQTIAINGQDTWHRVRVGPFTDLASLEAARTKLRQNHIDTIVLRIRNQSAANH